MVEVKLTVSTPTILRVSSYLTIILMYYYIREESLLLKEATSNKYSKAQLPPDQRMFQFFSAEDIDRWLGQRHFTFRHEYLYMLIIDSLFALLYGFAGADLLTWCAFRLPEDHWIRKVATTPLLAALLDMLENIMLISLSYSYPTRLFFGDFVQFFTLAKYLLLLCSAILIPMTLLLTYREEKNKID